MQKESSGTRFARKKKKKKKKKESWKQTRNLCHASHLTAHIVNRTHLMLVPLAMVHYQHMPVRKLFVCSRAFQNVFQIRLNSMLVCVKVEWKAFRTHACTCTYVLDMQYVHTYVRMCVRMYVHVGAYCSVLIPIFTYFQSAVCIPCTSFSILGPCPCRGVVNKQGYQCQGESHRCTAPLSQSSLEVYLHSSGWVDGCVGMCRCVWACVR